MRKKCIVCGAPLFDDPIYVCRNMPAKSQDLPIRQNVDEDFPIDFNLCQCTGCGLVQFDCEPVAYYKDSTRAGERSGVLIELRKKQYKKLIENYNLSGKKIIELGAGKGGFLKTLKEMTEYGIKEYGIENNPDFVKCARDKYGVNVFHINPESDEWTLDGAPFNAFCTFAYPARLLDPNAFLRGISRNLVDEGVGLVMVASLEHLLERGGFYDITADHIAYYNKDTLTFLLEKNGFIVEEIEEVATVYICATVKKRKPIDLNGIWHYVDEMSDEIRGYIEKERLAGRKIAAWCAGHFAFTILSTTGISGNISYIIDNASFKQGKFAPASHVPIVSAEHFRNNPVDTIMILGPMYIDEIVKEIYAKCSESIKIVSVDKEGIREL